MKKAKKRLGVSRGGARLPPAPPATPAGRLEPPAQEVRTACEEARTAFEEANTTCERGYEEAQEVEEAKTPPSTARVIVHGLVRDFFQTRLADAPHGVCFCKGLNNPLGPMLNLDETAPSL